jgi:hypothetical protein
VFANQDSRRDAEHRCRSAIGFLYCTALGGHQVTVGREFKQFLVAQAFLFREQARSFQILILLA